MQVWTPHLHYARSCLSYFSWGWNEPKSHYFFWALPKTFRQSREGPVPGLQRQPHSVPATYGRVLFRRTPQSRSCGVPEGWQVLWLHDAFRCIRKQARGLYIFLRVSAGVARNTRTNHGHMYVIQTFFFFDFISTFK